MAAKDDRDEKLGPGDEDDEEEGDEDEEEDDDDEQDDDDDEDETAAEGEDADPLERVFAVVDEIESHSKRLEAIDSAHASPELAFRETSETVMSLLTDLGMAVADTLADLREELDELNQSLDASLVEPPREPSEDVAAATVQPTNGTSGGYSHLSAADAAQILEQLHMFRAGIEIGIQATDNEDARSSALDQLAKLEATIARVAALAAQNPQA